MISNDTNLTKNSCKWLIVENFDKHVYVDVYELRQKIYEQMYSFYLSNKVNTETAEYRSRKFQLFLFLNNDRLTCNERSVWDMTNETTTSQKYKYRCRFTIRVPIHVRYHAPLEYSSNTSISNITFENNSDEEESTNEYYKFVLKRPRIFVTSCTFKMAPKQINFDVELPCEKNKTLRNDYLFYLENKKTPNASLLKDYQKLCNWEQVKFSQVISMKKYLIY